MLRSLSLLLLSLAAFGMLNASPLYVSASGRFSSSDIAGPLVAPDGQFTLSFVVDSNPVPLAGSVTNVGFDVPVLAFSYSLNGSAVNFAPREIRFDTLGNGGLFDIIFASGFAAPQLSFQGAQAFSGTTATPVFSLGAYAISSWTYSDAQSYDVQTPVSSAISITPTPEPSSIFLIMGGCAALFAVTTRRSRPVQ